MTNYGAYLEKLTEEFPKFDLKKKSESKLMKFLSLLLKIISFGNMKNFMDKYITTIGYTVYVPDGWANKPDDDKIIILRHEAVHMRQRERLGFVLMSLIYLFFIFPVVFAIGRATLEREAYKETIKAEAEGEGKYIRQSGGRGQYGHCFLRLEPVGRGEGYEFVDGIKGGAIPKEFISPIEKGVKEAMENGVIAGYPLVDMRVTLFDGTYHDVDSSEIAFKIAGSMALQNGVKQAQATLLEPIMKVEVTTPDEFMGDVIGDLGAKRSQILGTTKRGTVTVILAMVPLAELAGYATTLRSMSKGRATYYMEPSHYEEVPRNIQEKIIAKQV